MESELGSDTDGDDGDDEIPPYDPATERFPMLPIYHPAFQQAEELTHSIIRGFQEFIATSNYKDDEIKYLLRELEELEHPKYPTALRIGLIGDSGVGKSSLINSLLGVESIAPQVRDKACT
jgi:ribosome biogenesis GTPase A